MMESPIKKWVNPSNRNQISTQPIQIWYFSHPLKNASEVKSWVYWSSRCLLRMFLSPVVFWRRIFETEKQHGKRSLIYVSCFWKTTVGVSLCHWIPTPKQVNCFWVPFLFANSVFFQSLPFWRTASSPVLQANFVSDGFLFNAENTWCFEDPCLTWSMCFLGGNVGGSSHHFVMFWRCLCRNKL